VCIAGPKAVILLNKMAEDAAIVVRSAYKHYGSKKHGKVVLENLNMTVPRGSM
jgi:hypothetical protein